MAQNSSRERLGLTKAGKERIFVPTNLEYNGTDDNFITTPKLVLLLLEGLSGLALITWLWGNGASIGAYLIFGGLYFAAVFFLMRFVFFEEKYYYKNYKKMKHSEITTPGIAWDIVSRKKTDEGDVFTFADGKVGIYVRLERDTVTGKEKDFKEKHYDALSEFLRELGAKQYKFVYFNLMKPSGDDPRFSELEKLVLKDNNENVKKLMEALVGHIKNKAHVTLYTTEYYLIYTDSPMKGENIIFDVKKILGILNNGGYIGAEILDRVDVVNLVRDIYGVQYFDITDATLRMYADRDEIRLKPFKITAVGFDTGGLMKVDNQALNRLYDTVEEVKKGEKDVEKVNIREILQSKRIKAVSYESMVDDLEVAINTEKSKPKKTRVGLFRGKSGNTVKTNEEGFTTEDLQEIAKVNTISQDMFSMDMDDDDDELLDL